MPPSTATAVDTSSALLPTSDTAAKANLQSISVSMTAVMPYTPTTSSLAAVSADSNARSVASTAIASASGDGKEKNDHQAAFAKPTGVASNLANTALNTVSEAASSIPEATSTKTPDTLNAQIASQTAKIVSPIAAAVQIPASNTYMFAPVTAVTSASSVAKPTYNYPSAQNGNAAMASGFNQVYKTLSETSHCDATDTNQAFACISGELAQCQADGTYVLKSCDNGQSCYALPKSSGQTGVSVECAIPSDAAARLAAQPTSAPATANADAPVSARPASSAPSIRVVSQAASAAPVPAAHSAGNESNSSSSNDKFQTEKAQTFQATSTAITPATHTAESENNLGGLNGNSQITSAQISQTASAVRAPATLTAQNGNNEGSLSKLPKTESVQIPVETSASFPQPEANSHVQPEQSAKSTVASATPTAQAENQSPQDQQHSSKASSEATSSAAAAFGPLFSVVDAAPSSPLKHQEQQVQPTPSPPATSAPTPEPSVLAEQRPAPAPETSAAPAPSPHFLQTAEQPQHTQHVDTPTPASSADAAGITFQPLGGNIGVNNNQGGNGVAEEKVAIGNNNGGKAPIYITVTTTVTTTAYTRGP